MGLLGNQLQSSFSTTVKDTFNGTGSQTEFTLSKPSRTNDVEVFVENVQQEPTVAYSVSGTTLTFTAAPESGTGNIYVVHRTQATQSLTVNTNDITDGAITAGKIADGVIPDAVIKSATAPSSPADGDLWYDTTNKKLMVYNSTESDWETISSSILYDVEYLIVAGGGGGGGWGGGGGAGGLLTSSTTLTVGTDNTITVGAGGAEGGSGGGYIAGTSGEDSIAFGLTAIGGGGGGAFASSLLNGKNGGSGGGGSLNDTTPNPLGGSGTLSQGNDGGAGFGGTPGGYYLRAGGGGGAGAAGNDGRVGASIDVDIDGAGGDGSLVSAFSDFGDSGYFAGGGGGHTDGRANYGSSLAAGGQGGGGHGGSYNGTAAADGTSNTGGGGGGSHGGTGQECGAGGSGVVIIRYAGSQRGTGGTVTSSGGYTYHAFTSSGTYTA